MKKNWIGAGLLVVAATTQAQVIESTPENSWVGHVVVHPYDSQRLVATTSHDVTYVTRDGGLTWRRPQGLPQYLRAERMFADPARPNVIYLKEAVTYVLSFHFAQVPEGGRLYKSMDFGESWHLVDQEPPVPPTGPVHPQVVTPAAVEPTDPLRLYGTKRDMMVCRAGCVQSERELTLHESRDGGRSWSAPLFDGGTTGLNHVSYPKPAAPGRLFVVDKDYAAFMSIDQGRSWQRFPISFTNTPFWIEQDLHDGSVLYAAGRFPDNSRTVVARSDDAGQSWRTLLAFPEGRQQGGRLTLDPYRPGRAWLPTEAGLFRTDDRGSTWTSVGYGAEAPPPGVILAERLPASKVVPSPADDMQALVVSWKGRLERIGGGFVPRRAVEYRLGDRYWVSGDRGETASQDHRAYEAVRTGKRWGVWSRAERPVGAEPVCRFQGNPAYGQSSRFITLAGSECDLVKANPAFVLEGEGEYFALPAVNGVCAAGAVPVRRFNNLQPNVNHRYVADAAVAEEMRAAGWYDEGVRMCARPLGADE